MADEPENLVLEHLRAVRADIARVDAKVDGMREELKSDVSSLRAEMKSNMRSLRADVASDMVLLRKDIGEQVVGLRRAVMEYHSSVIGHGMIISDLEARVRRVEQHLNLGAMDAH